ncbi:hypothetical protein P7C70_g9132, partial [Phenoliferia sp. Uapishka_3]
MPKAARKRKTFASDAASAPGRTSKNSRAASAATPTAPSAGAKRATQAAAPTDGIGTPQNASQTSHLSLLLALQVGRVKPLKPLQRQSDRRKHRVPNPQQVPTDLSSRSNPNLTTSLGAGSTVAIPAAQSALEIVVGTLPSALLSRRLLTPKFSAAPPAFPIPEAPVAQPPVPRQHTPPIPPSPSTTATEIEPSPSSQSAQTAIVPPANNRALARQGAVVLDSAIDPELLGYPSAAIPIGSPADAQALPRLPAPRSSPTLPAASGGSSRAGRAGNALAGELNDSEDEVKEKVEQPKDWSDPYSTLAYVKYKRVKITDLTKRTNHLKKSYFKMRRDAMALEVQTGAYVGLFVCKAHKNRDDDQHSYNFHFSDTIIHNVLLVEVAQALKKQVKEHMQAIWATGVGKGESSLIIKQRALLAEANAVAGTLRAQAVASQKRSKGQEKEIKRQEKAMLKQQLKLADMQARLRAAGVQSDASSSSDDSSDSDDEDPEC